MSIAGARLDLSAPPRAQALVFSAIAAASLALAAVVRLRSDLAAPLWLDESWTGAFASQPTLATLTEQVRNDANAPAYYYLIWAWARFFGLSNAALHVPSLIVSFVTPAIAWAGLRRGRPVLALAWSVLLATWLPGIDQADEARCYALLLCAATASTVLHLRLLEQPSHRHAAAWAAGAAFMTLIHYYAGVLALAQGVAFVALHRGRALRVWAAALAFCPAFAWIAWHAPRLAEFARPGVAWYDRVPIADLPLSLFVLAGSPLTLASFALALLVGIACRPRPVGERSEVRGRVRGALGWAGGAALAAAALCVAVGVMRPTLTYRYLTPFVPGTSLLAAAWVVRIGRSPHLASAVLTGGPLIAVALTSVSGPNGDARLYNFEIASAWLAEAEPTRLAFFWDHPSTPVMARSQLDAIGGFFLRRAGLRLDVTPVYPVAQDMNGPTMAAAAPDAAVLWMYDILIHDTTARNHPPRLPPPDPGYECRNFGRYNVGIVACRRFPGHGPAAVRPVGSAASIAPGGPIAADGGDRGEGDRRGEASGAALTGRR